MTPEPSAAAVAVRTAASAERVRPNMRLPGLLALGHMVIDTRRVS